MNFTGESYRYFIGQTGDFSVYGTVSPSDNSEIGLLGNPNFKIRFQNGQIRNNENKFVGAYSRRSFDYRLNFYNNKYDLLIDNTPVTVGTNIGSYAFSGLRGSGNFNASFYVDGDVPTIAFPHSDSYAASNGSFSLPITSSDSRQVKIFGIDIQTKNKISVSSYSDFTNSGDIAMVFSNSGVDSGNFSYSVYTNAGTFTGDHTVYGVVTTPTGWYTNVSSKTNTFSVYTRPGYLDITARMYRNPKLQDVNVSLNYVLGSGDIYESSRITGMATGSASGYLNGSGFLYGSQLSGYGNYYGVVSSGTAFFTGDGYSFQYATGAVVYNYSVLATSLGDGGILSTGTIIGSLTGTVVGSSGYFLFNQQVVGTPGYAYNQYGYISNPTGNYTGSVFNYVNATGNFVRTVVTAATGTHLSFSGDKTFYGTWDLWTGASDNSYISYENSNWKIGQSSYSNDGITTTNPNKNYYDINIKILYKNSYSYRPNDLANLVINNGFEQVTIPISGRFVS